MASQPELLRLFQQSGAFHFDGTGVEGANVGSLNFHALTSYFDLYDLNIEDDEGREGRHRRAPERIPENDERRHESHEGRPAQASDAHETT